MKWLLLWTLALCWGLILSPALGVGAAAVWTLVAACGLGLTAWSGVRAIHARPPRPRLAVHEAGHALYLAAAPRDAGCHVTLIPTEIDGRVVYGSVTYHRPPDAPDDARLRWEMQYALAGEVAEELTFGQGSGGNVQDLEWFAAVAGEYLGHGGDHAALRAQEEASVRRFLCENRAALQDVARCLAQRGELHAEQVYALLGGVRLTPGVACMTGPAPAPTGAVACTQPCVPPYSPS